MQISSENAWIVYTQLEKLVSADRYAEATELCEQQIAKNHDLRFWETQLGYVCFLYDGNDNAQYNQAPAIFSRLVAETPLDTNAHFWLGYINTLRFDHKEMAIRFLQQALALDPQHCYANLVLAGMVSPDMGIKLLQQTLRSQPANFRVLAQLYPLVLGQGDKLEAVRLMKVILTQPPYIETHYGVMNTYINDVLTAATHSVEIREEAQTQIENFR